MALSRRSFLGIAAAGVGGAAVALTGLRRVGGAHVGSVGQPLAPPIPLSGRVHDVALTARSADWDIGNAGAAHAWTYNGAVPGPELRVTAGDTLRVALKNELPEPTTIHWHGVPVPFAMDGVPELTQTPVAPGTTFIYEFPVTTPGTFWYHTHVGYQLDRGLYGALIVEPQRETLAYDQEYTLVFDDWLQDPDHPRDNPDASGMGGMGGMGGMNGMGGMMGRGRSPRRGAHGEPVRLEPLYDALIVNGRQSAPDLRVRRGDRVRLRLVNAGSALPVAVWIAGHELQVTHADGQPVEPRSTRMLVLGMGERYDVLVTATHPGVWPLTAAAGGGGGQRATVLLRYDGVTSDAPEFVGAPPWREALRYVDLSPATPLPAGAPDRKIDLELSGGMMDPARWTINGRQYPDTEPIEVRHGERVRLRLYNMSMMPHPMHLHGHFFQVMSFDGRRLGAPILKDTITLGHMEAAELDVVADNPGSRWLLHCHNVYHMMGGMQTQLRYV
jgi:FtsP/CotA-like multicopper oxidase with cupredoxin domain